MGLSHLFAGMDDFSSKKLEKIIGLVEAHNKLATKNNDKISTAQSKHKSALQKLIEAQREFEEAQKAAQRKFEEAQIAAQSEMREAEVEIEKFQAETNESTSNLENEIKKLRE